MTKRKRNQSRREVRIGPYRGIAAAAALFALLGCNGPLEVVEVFSATEPESVDAFPIPEKSTASVGSFLLRDTAGDFGNVRYFIDPQTRVYFFAQDLDDAVTAGAWMRLPQVRVGAMAPVTLNVATPGTPAPWRSARAYDVGMCGSLVSWTQLGALLVQRVDAYVFASSHLSNASRTVPVSLQPILRAGGRSVPRVDDVDRIDLRLQYHASGVASVCNDVTLSFRVVFGIQRVQGVISRPPRTPPPSSTQSPSCTERRPGGGSLSARGLWDIVAVVDEVDVEVSDLCIFDSIIEGEVEEAVSVALVDEVRREVLRQTQVQPGFLQQTQQRFCTCDEECNPESVQGPWIAPGRRHVCIFTNTNPRAPQGSCAVQLEPDRVMFRPEGVQLVFAENNTDFQNPFFSVPLLLGFTIQDNFCPPSRDVLTAPEQPPTTGTLAWPIVTP